MKVAIIVAHPDDETIWSGGLILQKPEWEWTVLSLCRADDPDRSRKFESVSGVLGFHAFISNVDDSNPLKQINAQRDIGSRILNFLASTCWDLCLTHGANGEYGHPRHKAVHDEVVRLLHDRTLECHQLWTFAYECNVQKRLCRPHPDANFLVHLADKELLEKRRIVHREYGFAEDSFEVRSCVTPESFRRSIVREEQQ
jgi:LmbE family N-acetylglucosaminyl deacetylase